VERTVADLTNPIFTDADKAREYLEARRWPNGPVCPHCGSVDENVVKLAGKSTRPGLYACKGCRGHFSVTVGTVYERSHIPLNKWLLATHLMCAGKKGTSAHQLHRMLGITYKSAWFMAHRIREAMKDTGTEPMGGEGQHVEADETYIGRKPGRKAKQGVHHMHGVVSLVERGGKSRTFFMSDVTADKLAALLKANVSLESTLNTDEALRYRKIGKQFAEHQRVNHGKGEYGVGDNTTNSVEGFFSIFKRGMKGVYQHCSTDHMHRYLAEFDFRYSNRAKLGVSDRERADKALKGIEGKRLTYRRTDKQPETPSLG
jgi:transposase-like protein